LTAPVAANTYTLRFGAKAVGSPQPKTDLRVSRRADIVEITTRHIGVRLRWGRKASRARQPAAPRIAPSRSAARSHGRPAPPKAIQIAAYGSSSPK